MGAVFVAKGHYLFVFENSTLEQTATATSPFEVFSQLVYHVTSFLAMAGIYIKGFRYAALKEGGDKWLGFPFNMRLLKMFLYYLLITILSALYIILSAGIVVLQHFFLESVFVTILLAGLFAAFGVYLITRIVLTFLYVAIDQEKALRTSWSVMKGNVWHFLLLIILIGLTVLGAAIAGAALIGIVGFLLSLISSWLGAVIFVLFLPFGLLVMLLSTAWTINAVTYVNKQITAK